MKLVSSRSQVRRSVATRIRRQRFRRTLKRICLICGACFIPLLCFLPKDVYSDGKLNRLVPRIHRELRREYGRNWNLVLHRARNEPLFVDYRQSSKHIVVLTLERNNRSSQLHLSLQRKGLEFKFMKAIDGSRPFSVADVRRFGGKKRVRLFDPDFYHGWKHLESKAKPVDRHYIRERMRFGCFLTHVHTWEEFYNTIDEFIIILEDDVILDDNFSIDLPKLMNTLPVSWDLFYLKSGHTHSIGRVHPGIIQVRGALGTFGYVLSRRGAYKLLKQIVLRTDKAIDHLLDSLILEGKLHAFQAEKALVLHRDNTASTIEI